MLNPRQSSQLPPSTVGSSCLRVATYNIHKGVRGMGPTKRLEIHNLGLAVEALCGTAAEPTAMPVSSATSRMG